jgi:hypothetical protein
MPHLHSHDHDHALHRRSVDESTTLSLMQMSITARLMGALAIIVLLWLGVILVLQ